MIDLETPSELQRTRAEGPDADRRRRRRWLPPPWSRSPSWRSATAATATSRADQPSPTVTVPPTVPPRALRNAGRAVRAGDVLRRRGRRGHRHRGSSSPSAPAGPTSGTAGRGLNGQDLGVITFSRPDRVFADACHPSEGFYPGPVRTTVDGLVTALSEQGGWVDVTAPSDISVDGYAGKAFQRNGSGPTSPTATAAVNSVFRSWENGYRRQPQRGLVVLRTHFRDRVRCGCSTSTASYHHQHETQAGKPGRQCRRWTQRATLDTIRIEQV